MWHTDSIHGQRAVIPPICASFDYSISLVPTKSRDTTTRKGAPTPRSFFVVVFAEDGLTGTEPCIAKSVWMRGGNMIGGGHPCGVG